MLSCGVINKDKPIASYVASIDIYLKLVPSIATMTLAVLQIPYPSGLVVQRSPGNQAGSSIESETGYGWQQVLRMGWRRLHWPHL